jgi:hypothetical protein
MRIELSTQVQRTSSLVFKIIAKKVVIVLAFGLAACGADMRRNQPEISLVSQRSLDETASCLIREMNVASLDLTNKFSQVFNTAPVVTNEIRIIDIGKIYEIGPVQPSRAEWYVVRVTALPSGTKIEFHPSPGRPDLRGTFEPALSKCA